MKPDAELTAEYVQQEADRLIEKWSTQDSIDDRNERFIMAKNEIEAMKSADSKRPEVKGYRSNYGYTLVRDEAALLTNDPGLHGINPDPENEDNQYLIEKKLEPFAQGSWKMSQQTSAVWPNGAFDLVGLGRYWDSVLPHPHLWGTSDFEDAAREYAEEKDEREKESKRKALEYMKACVWPIRWIKVPARNTWTDFDTEYHLPLVIEIRQMTDKAIVSRWGEDALPKKGLVRNFTERGTSTREVLIAANYNCSVCVIGDKDDPRRVSMYHHGFGRSPYGLCEAELALDNQFGIRWLGHLFGLYSKIETIDSTMSDFREVNRDETRTARYVTINSNLRGPDDPLVSGKKKTMDFEDGTVFLDGETPALFPTATLNPNALTLLDKSTQDIESHNVRSILQGKLLSGTSSPAYLSALQTAQRILHPKHAALTKHAESVIERIFCSVVTLDDPVSLFPDMSTKASMLTLTPKEAKVWKKMWQARIDSSIDVDMNLLMSTAERMIAIGLDPVSSVESVVGVENAATSFRLGEKAKLRKALFEQVGIAATIQRLQGSQQLVTPEQQKQINQQGQGASPDLQQFLATVPQIGGGEMNGRSLGNMQRQDIPQNGHMTQEQSFA